MKHTTIALLFILLLASFLRLYRLDSIPPGVNRDEASIGYTAYSIAKTSNDEYGRTLPVSFESFGDWKLPLYIYLTIPFVKIFGLSELAVRLPSAIAGIGTVLAVYALTKTLFASSGIALMASLALAVMPWHIHISRVESEAIIATLATTLGLWQFLLALKFRTLARLIGSAILLASTYYTYHGNHITTSVLLIGMAILYWKDILKIRHWWYALCIGAILTIGILSATLLGADRTKISGIGIFGDPTIVHMKIEQPRLHHENPNSLVAKLIHNRAMYAVRTVAENYVKSYGPEFLFIRGGGNHAHNIEGYGNLHLIEAPLLLLGCMWLIMNFRTKHYLIVIWWILTGAIAAALTKDAPHSNRMLMVVPAFSIAVSGGIHLIWQYTGKSFQKVIFTVIAVLYLVCIAVYLDTYYTHFPKYEAGHWGFAYKKLIPILFSEKYRSYQIVMSHPEKSPYSYILFYSGYDPGSYQRESIRYPISRDGFTDVAGFGRFHFRAIDWRTDPSSSKTLIVTSPDEMPQELSSKVISRILLPDNTPALNVLDSGK